MGNIVFVVHIISSTLMAGVLWIVQLVHYPLFSYVDINQFIEFHRQHSIRITYIVGPAMILQLVSATLLSFAPPCKLSELPNSYAYAFLILTVFVFLATALLAIPEHQKLAGGYLAHVHQRLVITNWVRTLAYSLHIIAIFMALRKLMPTT